MKKMVLTPYQQTVRELSERIVKAQHPIRILDAVKWDSVIQEAFFAAKAQKLPPVTKTYYERYPLPFNPDEKKAEFYQIERDIRKQLGQFSTVGRIMQRMCREYREVVRMLKHRGELEFTEISQQLYGGASDAFHAGEPNLRDLASMISGTLANLGEQAVMPLDEKVHTSEMAVKILSEKLHHYFSHAPRPVQVKISDGIIADAAAGADTIKLPSGALFSDRELRMLEIHEGWVHIGTTLNGLSQPICTFLSKGPPSSTITQEGLAIIMEIFTFSSYPHRVRRLTDRITAIQMAESGGNFLDVYQFYLGKGLPEQESYFNASRVFRGSLPDAGPFTKDLVYNKGFVMIYNYIQLAIIKGLVKRIPLLFLGKTNLQDLKSLEELIDEKLVIAPRFVPPQFADLGALTAWMSYANFLRSINYERMEMDFRDVL